MNASAFRIQVALVLLMYAAVVGALAYVSPIGWKPDGDAYSLLKDAVPLLIAGPAAWLASCFQRRQAYLKDVRELWTKLVNSVQDAIQYTHLQNPTQTQYGAVLKGLSASIEELRAVFTNIGEKSGKTGLFPFEEMKDIHHQVATLGFGSVWTAEAAAATRAGILQTWKALRKSYLGQCQRGEPANPKSPYLQ